MRFADTLELRRWILSFGAEAEMLEPESLREKIRAEAQAILDQFEAGRHAAFPGQLPLPIADLLEELVLSSEPS